MDIADREISETSKEAINGSQLYQALQRLGGMASVTNANEAGAVVLVGDVVNYNAIGANTAALAALHPLPYTPDSKLQVAVGYGRYQSESAMALGVFYAPNSSFLISTGIVMGAESNQVYNVGLSYRVGKQSDRDLSHFHAPKDEDAMLLAYEVKRLQEENKQQSEMISRLERQLNDVLAFIKK